MAFIRQMAFGVHQYTLSVRAKRAEVLSSNIANADAPGFKARDINFSQALQDAQGQQGFGLSTTSESTSPCRWIPRHDPVPQSPATGYR